MYYNKCIFVGKVKETPNITGNEGQKQASFTFTVTDRVQGSNNQWVDRPMDLLMFTKDQKKVNVIEQYVKPRQELLVESKYVGWVDDQGHSQHAFQVLSIGLGYTPKAPNESNASAV